MNLQMTIWDAPREKAAITYTEIFRGEEVPKGYAEMVRRAEAEERNKKITEIMNKLSNKLQCPLIQITNTEQYENIRKPLH